MKEMRCIQRREKAKNNTKEISKQSMTNSQPKLERGERTACKLKWMENRKEDCGRKGRFAGAEREQEESSRQRHHKSKQKLNPTKGLSHVHPLSDPSPQACHREEHSIVLQDEVWED